MERPGYPPSGLKSDIAPCPKSADIVAKVAKIVRRQKSRESRFFDVSIVARLDGAATTARGCF
jgi:hypothetical protein